MTDRCSFIAKVVKSNIEDTGLYLMAGMSYQFHEIQCANEPNHSGDHLIVVPRLNTS